MMKHLWIKYSRRLCVIVPVLMLLLILTSITVSAFHNHHDCENPENCVICSFQVSTPVVSLETSPGLVPYGEPILLSIIALPERVTEPFHTSVFPSHAPPQFS